MGKSINRVILLGNLGKDAETKFTPNGNSVTNFSLATERSFKKGDEWVKETDWHKVTVWGAESVSQYLLKGTKVAVEGRLQTRSYDDKEARKVYVTEVVCQADGLTLCGGGGGQQQSGGQPVSQPRSSRPDNNWENSPPVQTPGQHYGGTGGGSQGITDDDVPF